MLAVDLEVELRRLATRYVWWKTPEQAMAMPQRVVAQVMHIGDYDDVQALVAAAGDDYLRQVPQHAEAGQLDERSWAYWHYRLGLAELGSLPPLPRRLVVARRLGPDRQS
jgi:hypothetical protein